MFSSTTMELSTNIPAAKVIPARLTTFRLRPKSQSMINVPMMLMGMASPMTSVLLPVRKNRKRTVTASRLPIIRFCCTSVSELLT